MKVFIKLFSALGLLALGSKADDFSLTHLVNDINVGLSGMEIQIASMSLYADEEHAEMGREIIFSDRGNKQIGDQWVWKDGRRGVWGVDDGWGSENGGITWTVDVETTTSSGLSSTNTTTAIEAAMATWQDVSCSEIPLEPVIPSAQDDGIDLGYVQWMYGAGGSPFIYADIAHAGFLPPRFFDAISPDGDGGDYLLGVAFTFVWDGTTETAFTEIYYNDNVPWSVDGVSGYDVETVALHEAGHGLSQAHFGKGVYNEKKDKMQYSPRAVMNAYYSGVQHEIEGTDKAGHCSIWAKWPH